METTKIAVRVHKRENETLLAACDEHLLGKTLEGEGFDVTIKEDFYMSEVVEKEAFLKLLEESTSANLMGKNTVGAVLEANAIDETHVRDIGGVPHVQIYSV